MKVYIAGPMTGLPGKNFPAFHAADAVLTGLGHDVINPTAAEGRPDIPREWSWYMRRALKMLLDADAVALLPGSEESRGMRTPNRRQPSERRTTAEHWDRV